MRDPEDEDEEEENEDLADVICLLPDEEGKPITKYATTEIETDDPEWKAGLESIVREHFSKPFPINPKCFQSGDEGDEDEIDD